MIVNKNSILYIYFSINNKTSNLQNIYIATQVLFIIKSVESFEYHNQCTLYIILVRKQEQAQETKCFNYTYYTINIIQPYLIEYISPIHI